MAKKIAVVLFSALGLGLLMASITPLFAAPTQMGSTMVLGAFDGDSANAPGEVSFQISSMVTGMPMDSLQHAEDTVRVDTGFAFSSLESLWVPNCGGRRALDSVCIQYVIQNYGNYYSDSFEVSVKIPDTTQVGHFAPNYFRIVDGDSNTERGVAISLDSASIRVPLAPAAFDTFVIKMRIPMADSAQDQDTIKVAVRVRDRHGWGMDDSWPNTSVRPVIDSTDHFIHTHTSWGMGDTLWDYGDEQYDTVYVAIGGPMIRTKTLVTAIDGSRRPGDRLDYSMYYDNDGSASSVDTGFFVAYLPIGAMFIDTVAVTAGNGTSIKTYLQYNGAWLEHVPDPFTVEGADSLARVGAVRFAVPPGINPQVGDNTMSLVADDSTGMDAGLIKFRVRIR